jgi:hypothetical protein
MPITRGLAVAGKRSPSFISKYYPTKDRHITCWRDLHDSLDEDFPRETRADNSRCVGRTVLRLFHEKF